MHILIIVPEQIPVPPPLGEFVEHCIYQLLEKYSLTKGNYFKWITQ